MRPVFLGFRPFDWKILLKLSLKGSEARKQKATQTFMNVMIWRKIISKIDTRISYYVNYVTKHTHTLCSFSSAILPIVRPTTTAKNTIHAFLQKVCIDVFFKLAWFAFVLKSFACVIVFFTKNSITKHTVFENV